MVKQLNPDEVCDPHNNWHTLAMAMSDWERTNSPLAYWQRTIDKTNANRRSAKEVFADAYLNTWPVNISFGLPTWEAVEVCKTLYR